MYQTVNVYSGSCTINVSGNHVTGNTGDYNGINLSVGNTTHTHATKKVRARIGYSSTNGKSSPPSQTQITKDDKPEDDQKPCILVSGNTQVSGNTGDTNRRFSVDNTAYKHRLQGPLPMVHCSNCDTPLLLPPGAKSIRCALCHTVTHAPPPPSPYNQAPPGPTPNVHGRKKAVICGISYKYSRHELKSCINDAKCMRYLLINKFKFPEDSILMLTEEETSPFQIPTKCNIRVALCWLVQGCQPGDSLLFYFSGHGSRKRDYHGDKVDGYDETLCPLDFETQGMIHDDWINATIVRPIPHGVKLHAIIDSCHSGTLLDLPFLCRMDRGGKYVWEDHRPPSGVWKGTSGGEIISISGCDDHQTSAETTVNSAGAITFGFIQAIEHGQAATYGSILNSMRNTTRSTGSGGGAVTSLVGMLLRSVGGGGGGLRQEPQLTASKQFDVYTKPFAL